MENKKLLLKGRTGIYDPVVFGCLSMPILFYLLSNFIWHILGFSINMYFYTLQVIISGLLIYHSLAAIYSYEVYEDCIIKRHYTKIKHNYIKYDNIKITKLYIGGYKLIIFNIYFTFEDKDYREGIRIDNKKQLEKLISYCRQNRIPYDDTPIFGERYD